MSEGHTEQGSQVQEATEAEALRRQVIDLEKKVGAPLYQVMFLESSNRQIKAMSSQEVGCLKDKVACLEEKEKLSRDAKDRVVSMLAAFEKDSDVDQSS